MKRKSTLFHHNVSAEHHQKPLLKKPASWRIPMTQLFAGVIAGLFLIAPRLHAENTSANSLSDEALLNIKFDQKLNGQVSPNLSFHDEKGNRIRMGDYFGRKPVILVLGYYECPMLCTMVLNGLIESLQDLKLTAGKEFEVVSVSINPSEKPALAAAKKRTYLKRYGRPGAETGWHFLTGDEPAIRQLADETGFRYAYDPSIKQYAHPSGLVILTSDGKIAHYLFGVTYAAKELDADLKDAGAHKVGSPVEQLLLLCFHYSPLHGKYGNLIMAVVRVSGVVTLAGLGIVVVVNTRRRKKRIQRSDDVATAGATASEEKFR